VAIFKSTQASTCKRGYQLHCTVRYLDNNTSGGYRLPCTVRYLDYNTSGGYQLPCTVRYLDYNTSSGLYYCKVTGNLAFRLGYFSRWPPQSLKGLLMDSIIFVSFLPLTCPLSTPTPTRKKSCAVESDPKIWQLINLLFLMFFKNVFYQKLLTVWYKTMQLYLLTFVLFVCFCV
jgi:hypothetical protein